MYYKTGLFLDDYEVSFQIKSQHFKGEKRIMVVKRL